MVVLFTSNSLDYEWPDFTLISWFRDLSSLCRCHFWHHLIMSLLDYTAAWLCLGFCWYQGALRGLWSSANASFTLLYWRAFWAVLGPLSVVLQQAICHSNRVPVGPVVLYLGLRSVESFCSGCCPTSTFCNVCCEPPASHIPSHPQQQQWCWLKPSGCQPLIWLPGSGHIFLDVV